MANYLIRIMQQTILQSAIGAFELPFYYAASARHFVISQLYAQAITQQFYLDVRNLDTGLAVDVQNYQELMKGAAQKFSSKVLPAYLQSLTEADNFSNLTQTLIQNLLDNLSQAKNKAEALSLVNEVSKKADNIAYNAKVLTDEIKFLQGTFTEFASNYNKTLENLINSAGQHVKETNDAIDKLAQEIAQNIEDVVDGAGEFGKAVEDIAVGVITKLGKIASAKEKTKPSDEKKTKEEEKKADESNNADDKPSFSVESIIVASSGVSKSTEAVKALELNNKKLAGLYQQLASEKALLGVAKAIQRQNDFFYNAISSSKTDIDQLADNWNKVNEAFADLKQRIETLNSKEATQELATSIEKSTREWQTLSSTIKEAKTGFTL